MLSEETEQRAASDNYGYALCMCVVANKWIHEFGQEFVRRCPLEA